MNSELTEGPIMRVMVQLRTSAPLHAAAVSGVVASKVTMGLSSAIPGLSLDPGYAPVQVPSVQTEGGATMSSLSQPLKFSFKQTESTYLVRGQIPDGAQQAPSVAAALAHPDVVGVYSDPLIESTITCIGSGPVGT